MPPPLRAAAPFALSYRPMTERDLPFVAALFASTRSEEVARTGWPEEQQKAFLAQQHQAQHQHYRMQYPDAEWLIIEQDDETIGRLYMNEGSEAIEIIDISLVPAARGKGMGSAILTDIIAAADDAGKKLNLHVERFNPALRLYLKLGFAMVDDQGIYLAMERPAGAEGPGPT